MNRWTLGASLGSWASLEGGCCFFLRLPSIIKLNTCSHTFQNVSETAKSCLIPRPPLSSLDIRKKRGEGGVDGKGWTLPARGRGHTTHPSCSPFPVTPCIRPPCISLPSTLCIVPFLPSFLPSFPPPLLPSSPPPLPPSLPHSLTHSFLPSRHVSSTTF